MRQSFEVRNKTGFRGVYLTRNKYYRSEIRIKNGHIYLGSFPTAQQAAQAYDHAAFQYFGNKAVLNFIDNNYPEDDYSDLHPTQDFFDLLNGKF